MDGFPECVIQRPDGCYEWTGAKRGRYGQWTRGNGPEYAHRVAYEIFNGPITDGHLIHHLCEFVFCVNPSHLVAVTRKEHGRLHRKKLCSKGHEMTAENTYEWIKDGVVRGRRCKICAREALRKWKGWDGRPAPKDQTHCVRGHPFSGDNLMVLKNGKRRCRICGRARTREYEQRKREAREAHIA